MNKRHKHTNNCARRWVDISQLLPDASPSRHPQSQVHAVSRPWWIPTGASRVILVHVLFSTRWPWLGPGKRDSYHGHLTCGINYHHGEKRKASGAFSPHFLINKLGGSSSSHHSRRLSDQVRAAHPSLLQDFFFFFNEKWLICFGVCVF